MEATGEHIYWKKASWKEKEMNVREKNVTQYVIL